MNEQVSDSSELSSVYNTILQPIVLLNVKYFLSSTAAEENMVSNKANPPEKQVETPALEINASKEKPLIDLTNRLGFFLPW